MILDTHTSWELLYMLQLLLLYNYLVALRCLVILQMIELAHDLAICLQIRVTWYECIGLEKLKKDRIRIGLKLV